MDQLSHFLHIIFNFPLPFLPRYRHQQAEAQHAHGTEMVHCGTQKQTETDLANRRSLNFQPKHGTIEGKPLKSWGLINHWFPLIRPY